MPFSAQHAMLNGWLDSPDVIGTLADELCRLEELCNM